MPRRETDPYPGFNFRLSLNMVLVGAFTECTGLQVEKKFETLNEGGRNSCTLLFPSHTSHNNITLKKGVTRSNLLQAWMGSVTSGIFLLNPRKLINNIAIRLTDEKGKRVKRWQLLNAFPVKWSGPDLKAAGGSDMAVETLEIACEGFKVLPPL
ncbi:MAG: phage tail protein [Acidobacteriota bacterium]|nr:phage tail protein [Acidobacteriota bacterium]